MGDFFNKHSYIIIWITALILIGAAALAIFDLNGYIPSLPLLPRSQPAGTNGATTQQPTVPAAPSVAFVIQKTKSGNSFFVQWQNLPNGTTALNIFRGKTGTPQDTWSLWKTVSIPSGELANGSFEINLNGENEDGYSFYLKAVDGNDGDTGTPLWISSSTTPIVTTSTLEQPGTSGNQNPPDQSSTPNNPGNNPPPSNPTGTSQGGSNNPPTPTGTPYYSPQVQISGYGSEHTGNFWVQQVDQKIQIGWQDIPQGVTDIVIERSQDQDGPWTTILAQKNPGTGGPYSIQLVDNTFGVPFYYELNAMVGTSTIATYGPVYLAGQGQ